MAGMALIPETRSASRPRFRRVAALGSTTTEDMPCDDGAEALPQGHLGRFLAWLRTPTGQKLLKYAAVSVISTVISQLVLFLSYGVFDIWAAVWCNVLANVCAAFPSYYLNRYWAWQKTGRSHPLKELLPFWVASFAGLALSLGTVDLAASFAHQHHLSHLIASVMVNGANLFAFGILWIGKFLLYNHVLFTKPGDVAPAGERSPADLGEPWSPSEPVVAAGYSGVGGHIRSAEVSRSPEPVEGAL